MLDAKEILIGTRASKLALKQAEEVKENLLSSHPHYQKNPHLIKIITFKTTGDRIVDRSLVEIGGKGLFIKEIEEALLAKKIDFAVHSMKDMPAFFADGLEIAAVLKREDARDAFISPQYSSIDNLPQGSVIGTSSPRRAALLLHKRPDLKIVNFRGNVDTRLEKVQQKQVDATILAAAGLQRIGMKNHITAIIDESEMLPAIGQGALALQARTGDQEIINLLKKINHQESYLCTLAERAFQKTINGSCKTPIAAHCQIKNNQLYLQVLLSSLDGKEVYRTSRTSNLEDAEAIGQDAGAEIKKSGQHILENLNG